MTRRVLVLPVWSKGHQCRPGVHGCAEQVGWQIVHIDGRNQWCACGPIYDDKAEARREATKTAVRIRRLDAKQRKAR